MTRSANDAYERLIYAQQNRPSEEEWAKMQEEQAREERRDKIRRLRQKVA